MSAVWYTSDLHFGHKNCATWRGFSSVEQHDETVVSNWNARVKDDDIVWVLGDICLSPRNLQSVGLLKGRKQLIAGNHDAVHPMHRDAWKQYQNWLIYFESVQPFARRVVSGTEFLMSHFPYAGDHPSEARPDGSDRYSQYRLKDEGLPLLHGHTHKSSRVSATSSSLQIHVGVDAWKFTPVPENVVIGLMESR